MSKVLIHNNLLDYDLLKEDCEEIVKVSSLSDGKLKFRFTFFIFNIAITCFTPGFIPQYFYYYWHSWKCLYLFIHHWIDISKGWRYFFTDFCYFTNFLVLVYYWLSWKPSFYAVFILSNGPLLWSAAMKISVVPHSISKQTFCFLTFAPVLATWGTRWFSYEEQLCFEPTTSGPNGCNHVKWTQLIIWSMVFIGVWMCMYIVLRWTMPAQKYDYTPLMIRRAKKELIYNFIVSNFDPRYRQVVYRIFHLSYNILALVSACIAYHWMAYGLITIALMIIAASYNGSVFYMDLIKLNLINNN